MGDYEKELGYERLLIKQLLITNQRLSENNLQLRDKIDELKEELRKVSPAAPQQGNIVS